MILFPRRSFISLEVINWKDEAKLNWKDILPVERYLDKNAKINGIFSKHCYNYVGNNLFLAE